MSVNIIKFGGVELDSSDVKSKEVRTVKNRNGNEEQVYVVNFKNGTKVSYRGGEDVPCFKPYISSSTTKGKFISTNIYGVLGLELHGSKKYEDNIAIIGGSLIGVDVSNDDKEDIVKITQTKVEPEAFGVLGDDLPLYVGQVKVSEEDQTEIQQYKEVTSSKFGEALTPNGPGVHRVVRQ